MRIIAGKSRGTILESLEGEDSRPTLERVKENYFNAINFEVANAKVLDLFAGTGQLGLEALSRGAREAVFVDSDSRCVEIMARNAQKAKLYERCSIVKSDYADFLTALKKRRDFEKFDIIFMDPPYNLAKKLMGECVKKIMKNELISNGGLIICETGDGEQASLDLSEEMSEKIKKSRIYKYGKICITILTIEIISEVPGKKGESDGK